MSNAFGRTCEPGANHGEPFELSFLDRQLKLESEADAADVAAALAAHPEVTSFVLRGNTLGIGAGEAIARALEKCPNLKDCNWSDLFTGRLRSEIPIIVTRLCCAMMTAGVQLRSLDLSDNAFGPIGAQSIKDFLESDSAFALEELRLNNCGLGAGAVTVANSLLTLHKRANAAGRKLNLKVIVAGRNRLEIPGALAFAKAIGEIGTIEELTVHQNGIHRPGMIGLAEGVAKNPGMKRLSIADNVGGWEGALAFAKALPNLRSLESADFSDCLSKDKGCRALVQTAVRLPKLQMLNLSGSELTADVAERLVTLWSQNKTNQAILNISTNNLADEFGHIRELAKELGGRVDVGESDDDCGSLSGSETEEEESEEEELHSREDSEEEEGKEMGAGDSLAAALSGMAVQKPQPAAVAPAAAAVVPFELSFLDKQMKMESEADAAGVAAALAAHPEVTSFVLRGNTLGIGAGEAIARALEKCPNLKDCNWSDLFTGRLRSEIPIIVTRLCSAMMTAGVELRSLDLSDNAFGPIGAQSIKDFLESDSAFSLEELRLNNCGLGAGAVTVANSLLTLHKRANSAGRKLNLKVIVAGRNRLEIPGALAFAKAIGEIGTIEELTVHQNGIHRPGVIGLAEGVAKNPGMKRLSIADNVGGWEGALAFAKALPNLRSLEAADFSDCLSKDKGCRALVQVAVRLPKLQILNLSGSELTASVAEQLVTLWSQSRTDEAILNISTNNLADEFGHIRQLARDLGGRVDVGESDDDCGSLSGSEADDDDEEAKEDNDDDTTSDSEMNSGSDSEDDDDEDSEEDDFDLERSGASSKENNGLAAPVLQQQPPSLPSFLAAPSPSGLRSLAALGQQTLKELIKSLASARDQTDSARLFLSVVVVASGDVDVEKEAVEVLDALVVEVAAHPRKPIPTIVQLLNHVVAHVDQSIKREENLVAPSSLSRPVLERVLQQLQQRGRLVEATQMLRHYFPSATPATSAAPAAAAARQTFTFSFSGISSNQANTSTPVIPKFSFGK